MTLREILRTAKCCELDHIDHVIFLWWNYKLLSFTADNLMNIVLRDGSWRFPDLGLNVLKNKIDVKTHLATLLREANLPSNFSGILFFPINGESCPESFFVAVEGEKKSEFISYWLKKNPEKLKRSIKKLARIDAKKDRMKWQSFVKVAC